MSTFSFPGESHDFWEFVCVDKGEVTIGAGEETQILKRGEIRFHEPNEFHWVRATGNTAPNLIVISFSCKSPLMDFFRGKTLRADDFSRGILARVIREAGDFLSGRLDDPYQTVLKVSPHAPKASGQLIQLYLEQLLIYLYRRYCGLSPREEPLLHRTPDKTMKENMDEEAFSRIVEYLTCNLTSRITIEKICRDNLIGRSQL